MDRKEYYIEKVRNSPLLRLAKKRASSKEEAERIEQLTLGFVEEYASKLVPIIQKLKGDPEYAKKIREQLQASKEDEPVDIDKE